MRTQYEHAQGDFSYAAHIAAREQVYPHLFDVEAESITYEDVRLDTSYRGKVLDGEMGVDVVVHPAGDGSNARFQRPLPFFVQERFRRPDFARYSNITITEFNHASGQASELHKMAAGIMVYGIYDPNLERFMEAFAVDVARLTLYLQRGSLDFERQKNKKHQSFICLKLKDLSKASCLLWRLRETETSDALAGSPDKPIPSISEEEMHPDYYANLFDEEVMK